MSKLTIFIFIIALILTVNINGQSKKNTASIRKNKLTKIVNKAETQHIMFNIKKGRLYILDGMRNPLYPKRQKVKDREVFTVYTINDVLNKIEQAQTKRMKFVKDEFTGLVKFDNNTGISSFRLLEASGWACPPGCPNN